MRGPMTRDSRASFGRARLPRTRNLAAGANLPGFHFWNGPRLVVRGPGRVCPRGSDCRGTIVPNVFGIHLEGHESGSAG